MADAPAGGGPVAAITRKVGPLPVWAYAAILVVGYFLYRRMKGGGSSQATTNASGGPATSDQAYVPGFDAAGMGGGGGIGSTGTPSTVNNYYYGDQAAQQANGGGTSPGPQPGTGGVTGVMYPGGNPNGGPIHAPGPITTPRPVDSGVGLPSHPIVAPASTAGFFGGPPPYVPRGGAFVAN